MILPLFMSFGPELFSGKLIVIGTLSIAFSLASLILLPRIRSKGPTQCQLFSSPPSGHSPILPLTQAYHVLPPGLRVTFTTLSIWSSFIFGRHGLSQENGAPTLCEYLWAFPQAEPSSLLFLPSPPSGYGFIQLQAIIAFVVSYNPFRPDPPHSSNMFNSVVL